MVSESSRTLYSGMMTGYLAGLYQKHEIEIKIQDLCQKAGVHFRQDRLQGLDPDRRLITTESGEPLAYDLLSLNLGARTPSLPLARAKTTLLKPCLNFESFLGRLDSSSQGLQIAVVGAGPSGVEVACALAQRLRERGLSSHRLTLFEREARVLPSAPEKLSQLFQAVLERHHVSLRLSCATTLPSLRSELETFDEVIWALPPGPHPELGQAGLETVSGFLKVSATLQTSRPQIFAVGDVAMGPDPTPRAGVFAVRAAPVLACNLQSVIEGERPQKEFHPQTRWLSLMIDGFGGAGGSRGAWVLPPSRGGWLLKNFIDRRFLHSLDRVNEGLGRSQNEASG